MRLSHWSDEPIATVTACAQVAGHPSGKPRGLWVSVDGEDDWAWWCKAEEFRDVDAQLRYEVVLADDANVLLLDSPAAIRAFTREHGRVDEWAKTLGRNWCDRIDWVQVAAGYQGIVIAPYQWSMRLEGEAGWYYGWDCASGCIWDAAAIKELRQWSATSHDVAARP